MNRELKGIMPAIASPCSENDVFLEDKFTELAKNFYKQGVHGLYVCGATGDGYNMHLSERKRAVEIAVELSRDFGGKTIVHVGTHNTRDSLELAEHSAKVGVDAISAIPPPNHSFAQLVSYYTDIAKISQLPVLIYYIPMLSGTALKLDEILSLLKIEGVTGLKFSDWNIFLMKRILIHRPDILVFNGMDELLCPALLYGAGGGIGMNYNLFPRLFLGIYQAVKQNNIQRAMDLQNRYLEYANIFWEYGGIRPNFETIMREKGLAPYCFRRPRYTLDQITTQQLMKELEPIIKAIEEV